MDRTPWHNVPVDEVLHRLGTRLDGLTQSEVTERRARFGPNEVTRIRAVSWPRLLLRQFSSFFVVVLLFAAALAFAVSFLPGESGRRLTSGFILFIVMVSVALGFFEEYKAQQEVMALDELVPFRATVVRDGARMVIPTREVVPGDILLISQGQRIPADARVLESNALRADESALTGESVAVDKSPAPVPVAAALSERQSMLYGSTCVTYGSGLAVAVRTGQTTQVGRIAVELETIARRPTPFQTEVRDMARQMTVIVGALAIGIALILLFLLRQPVIDVALNTLSLAVATIPESLPIVLAFALALGARNMARRHAVVRRLSVVESLGSVDTICTDKTGTLTQNLMAVQQLYADGKVETITSLTSPTGAQREVLLAGLLCNAATVEGERVSPRITGDPVDSALVRSALSAGLDVLCERALFPKIDEVPFTSDRKMMTTIHQQDGKLRAYSKGAPGRILTRCGTCLLRDRVVPLSDDLRENTLSSIRRLQAAGLYVLGMARNDGIETGATKGAEIAMTFLGLQAMIDPPRSGVKTAIGRAHEAGIRVVMITGDNALTATSIARRIGIGDQPTEAAELDRLDPDALRGRVATSNIVARATPRTKQNVLQTLQNIGHFVAMTGDGVNDATALKQADVGVAMGLRGADIAKESADMVLTDDDFSTIVAAVEEGRRIFDNIRKFTNYLLSTSLGEVFAVLGLSLAGYFPLSAKMLLWINVVTDLLPASALAADPAVPDIMTRRPRHHDEPILNKAIYATIAGSIFRTLLAYTLIFAVGLRLGGLAYARTMLFTSIVLHAFTRVLVVRQLDALSIWSNRPLLVSYAVAVSLQILALYTPLARVFGVVPLDLRSWAFMLPVVAVSSMAGIYMTRWILKLLPLWGE